ncbi:MAG: 2-hydroxyacid dehydrogenase [Acidimicrobiia bacterium]|nr:2-hydroxyacid dehydrogenase [Acidimicrobiia bacterium]
MRVAVFSTRPYDRRFLEAANAGLGHELVFFEERLHCRTARLAHGAEAVCAFVSDSLDAEAIDCLADEGVRLIALRASGINNVDLEAAARRGLTVARVPAYSPNAIAEHTVGLMLALERKIHRAHARVREGNFSLEGLLGRELHGRTVGIIGTGAIGRAVARILHGFGCRLLAHDIAPDAGLQALGVAYSDLPALLERSEVVSLHCPLTPDTRHLIDTAALETMRPGVMLINTSRGGLIDTVAVIEGLKTGKVGSLGLDVYEEEASLFFADLSDQIIQDDVFSRLLTFPNVIITGHQAFFTVEAMEHIAATTLGNISAFAAGRLSGNEVAAPD